ncbi:MAG: neutral/alkaline non-lysosomal ceramidase N-terminal domain-containing protein [Planctomycetota bacterium]
MTRIAPLPLLVCFLVPVSVRGADTDFQVGFAREKITPSEPLWMSGYAGRAHGSTGILDDLFVQAMAVRDRSGQSALLLRVDICVLRDATVTQICQLIRQRTGLMRREILVNVSHTHSGPAVDELYHYSMSTAHREKLAAYMERLKAICADVSAAALKDLKPAILDFGVGQAMMFHNRRGLDANERYTGMRPNPGNHTDRDLPVLRITNPDGSVRGVIFGVACHNVTLGPNYEFSGDYAGQTRIQLEKKIPHALFVTGCGGDANPHGFGSGREAIQGHGASLSKEIRRVMSQPLKRIRGPIKTVFRYVDLPLVTFESRAEIEAMRRGPYADYGNVDKLLGILDRGAKLPTTFSAPFAVWQFGNDLTLAGLPEEAVSEYVPLLKKAIGERRLWTAGYCNDVSGYLPTVNIMKQGGYETRGLFANTAAGWFAPDTETKVVEAVREMVLEADRKVTQHSKPTPVETFASWRFDREQPHSGLRAHGKVPSAERGLRFGGTSYLEGPSPALRNAGEKGLTMAAWIKPDPAGMTGTRMIVCQWANSVADDRISLSLNDGRPGLGVADGVTGEQGFASNQRVRTNRWTFVAATWDPVTRRYSVYIDGQQTSTTGTQSGSGINAASKATLKIGAQASKGHPRQFTGLIDDVWIGNALNAAGIRRLFESQKK